MKKPADQASLTGFLANFWVNRLDYNLSSYFSIQLTGIAAQHPSDLDAVILTGYTPSMASVGISFMGWLQTLANQQPDMAIRSRWAGLPSGSTIMSDHGYLGTGSPSADRFAFFAEGSYDEGAFKLAYDTKQTHTLREFLTITEPVSKPATDYNGHVFVSLLGRKTC
ncbi:alpha/beta hydrolase family containing protein, partial [Rhizoctonia solani 123E]